MPVDLSAHLGAEVPLLVALEDGWTRIVGNGLDSRLDHDAPNRHDTGSTTARSGDEVALIRDTVSHYTPVLIAQNSSRPAPVAGPNFFYWRGARNAALLARPAGLMARVVPSPPLPILSLPAAALDLVFAHARGGQAWAPVGQSIRGEPTPKPIALRAAAQALTTSLLDGCGLPSNKSWTLARNLWRHGSGTVCADATTRDRCSSLRAKASGMANLRARRGQRQHHSLVNCG
jgi:hypothetical protein